MSKETSDILWSLVMLIMGVVVILAYAKKRDPYYKDEYGYRTRLLITGGFAVILGIYALCKILFFTTY
jgi:hypothetical protein